MDVGRRGIRRDADLAPAGVDPAGAQRLRLARRAGPGEAGQPDAPHRDASVAAVGGQRGDADRLARRHHAVVGQHLETQAVRQHGGLLELVLLRGQAEVDLPAGAVRERHPAQPRAQGAYPLQAGHHRLPRAGHALRLEPRERLASVPGQRVQAAREPRRRVGARKARQARNGRVHAGEERRFAVGGGAGQRRFRQPVLPAGRRGRQGDELRHALALVHAPGPAADLRVRRAEQRVVPAEIHGGQTGVRRRPRVEPGRRGADAERKPDPEVELGGLPWMQSRRDMLRKARRIGRGEERLARQNRRSLVVLSAEPPLGAHGGDHVRAHRANQAHEVAEDLLAAPARECLLAAERIAEVHRPGEVLLRAVEPVRRGQLLGPQDGQRVEQLAPDLVLPAVAPRRAQEHGPVALALRQQRQQRVVLVVGVGRDHHERAHGVELAERDAQLDLSRGRSQRLAERGQHGGGGDREQQ